MSSNRRISPSFVVSMLALVAALAMPAVAQVTTTALTRADKKVIRRIAAKEAQKQIAAKVRTPRRFVLNDPSPGDPPNSQVELFKVGSFTILGRCVQDDEGGLTDRASVSVTGPTGSSFSGFRGGTFITFPNLSGMAVAEAFGTGNSVTSGRFIAVAPNGQVLQIVASAEVNDSTGHCVLGVHTIGT